MIEKNSNIMTCGLYTSNLEQFGYSPKNCPILLPSVGPFSKTDTEIFYSIRGVFPWDGHSSKSSWLTILKRNKKLRCHRICFSLFQEAESLINIF